MAESSPPPQTTPATIRVAPSPHLSDTGVTTRRMMIDVLIGLAPVVLMSVVVFRWDAVKQIGLCVLACLVAETVFTWMRRKPSPVGDCSAAVTGVILALSLPASAPGYVAIIGSAVAIGLGKVVFGGLGCNIFNPAMVGRAFIMLSFAKQMGASAYQVVGSHLAVLSQATPLTAAQEAAKAAAKAAGGSQPLGQDFWPLFLGNVNGSLGETSALALLLGGIYLCGRRAAAWEIPAGTLLAAYVLAALAHLLGLTPLPGTYHLVSGALLLGAFFIATDPVTSPLSARGRFVFGLGVGTVVIAIRVLSGYPEGVMFAVLLMNALVPLLNRWTIPRPLGGPLPEKPHA